MKYDLIKIERGVELSIHDDAIEGAKVGINYVSYLHLSTEESKQQMV